MNQTVIRNGRVITPRDQRFTSVWIENGRISLIGDRAHSSKGWTEIDASGCYVTPGLVDLQVNGSPQCDLWANPTERQLDELRRHMLEAGVTTFLPTLITDELEHLSKNIEFLSCRGAGQPEQLDGGADLSRMAGLHLEGPCLSPSKPGVHPAEFIKPPSVKLFEQLVTPTVKLVTLAPEHDGCIESIEWLKSRGVLVSLGHSNATFDEAQRAFDAGVNLVTHLFNAMPPVHHRAPGAVGAALLNESVTCCLIADGLHLDPKAVELVFKLKGRDSTILVTDIAHIGTTGGELVGSSITLDQAVRNIVQWGIADFQDAIAMATYNPAEAIAIDDRVGILADGRLADLVIWDARSLDIRSVLLGGRVVEIQPE